MTLSTESAPDHSKTETPPPGTFKSIIPCTPLAVVKTLEHAGVYNKLLPYGDRAYGKTIVVINRCVYEMRGHAVGIVADNRVADLRSWDVRWRRC